MAWIHMLQFWNLSDLCDTGWLSPYEDIATQGGDMYSLLWWEGKDL